MTINIILSSVAIFLSVITSIRLFLLDKKYGEIIISKDNHNQCAPPPGVISDKKMNSMTINFCIKNIKSKLYNINITQSTQSIPFKFDGKDITIINEFDDDIVITHIFIQKDEWIQLKYEDEFNNIYKQKIYIFIKTGVVTISPRRWLICKSIKNRFFT